MALSWEYKVGPLNINFRPLMEPKGFLRIIIAFIALLAFATTAGFHSQGDNNTLTCPGGDPANPINYTVRITYTYPYDGDNYQFDLTPGNAYIANRTQCGSGNFTRELFYSSAQYFVGMGVLTMLYVIGALIIYVIFITPDLFMAKYLVIADLFLTIAFGVFYLLACIAWSAGVPQLNGYVSGRLNDFATNCFQCPNVESTGTGSLQNFAQPSISLIFGWLASFVWFASIWFVYKDTFWHQDRTGPLAKLYQRNEEGEGRQEGRETSQQRTADE